MKKVYLSNPDFITIDSIKDNSCSLSASQYRVLIGKNKNVKSLGKLLDRQLVNDDLGEEIGSEFYVSDSKYKFMKTKALQSFSYLPVISNESFQSIIPKIVTNQKLSEGDIIISKDSNVGEVIILDKEYDKVYLCGALYKLPLTKFKYYVLAFIKSDIFRQQIDFLVPEGSTIRHGKTKFLDCEIPFPNRNAENVIKYVEYLTLSIINKEKEIKRKYEYIINKIEEELFKDENKLSKSFTSINDIKLFDYRLDTGIYSDKFRRIDNQLKTYGGNTLSELGITASRGQNLQVSEIGNSIYSDIKRDGFYTLIRPKNILENGAISEYEYLGNSNKLSCLNKGDVVFGGEGTFRSYVVTENVDKLITNIHGIVLVNGGKCDSSKCIFIKLFLDYLREKEYIVSLAVGGNGGSLAIKYLDYIKFPNFPKEIENDIVKNYYNPKEKYDLSNVNIDTFLEYDSNHNLQVGINELDKEIKLLKSHLDDVLDKILNDEEVEMLF